MRYLGLLLAGNFLLLVGCKMANAIERMDVMYSPADAAISTDGSDLVAVAKRDIGKNPTGNRFLWCMDAINRWLKKIGHEPTGSRAARSILKHGKRVRKSNAKPGDIVFWSRRRGGGHVEVFAGWANDAKTRYHAVTGNSCGPRGRRYVCEVTRRASKIGTIIRP